MIRFRPLPLMSLLSVIALAVLLSLGRGQWEKYERKTAAAAEPVAEMTIESYVPIENGIQFVQGYRSDTREQGWRVFAPVQFGESVVFVDSDFIVFVPGELPPNAREVRFPAPLRRGDTITGAMIRPEGTGPFVAPPNLLARRWYAVDLPAMGRNAGFGAVADYYIAAAYVGADGRTEANPFALAPGADALPPARHLGYALTWYGLALVLLAIYFAYHVSVGRLAFAAPRPRED
jgi:surfeit locus 1 family protein